eukprot:scaffold22483_cov128-Skeletonema_dohrnii-CCMP3373.AAC.6
MYGHKSSTTQHNGAMRRAAANDGWNVMKAKRAELKYLLGELRIVKSDTCLNEATQRNLKLAQQKLNDHGDRGTAILSLHAAAVSIS